METREDKVVYIKEGELLHGQKGSDAKLKQQVDNLFEDIRKEVVGINPDALNESTKPNRNENEGDGKLAEEIIKVFNNGPLTYKPSLDACSRTQCKSKPGGFTANTSRRVKLGLGEYELAKAEFRADISSEGSVSREREEEQETISENSYEYSSGTSKVTVAAEMNGTCHGNAEAGLGEYKRKAELEGSANVKFKGDIASKYSVSCKKGEAKEVRSDNSYEYDSGTSRISVAAEMDGTCHGNATARLGKHKRTAELEGNANMEFQADLSSKYSLSHTRGEAEERRSQNSYEYDSGTSKSAVTGDVKVACHGHAEASLGTKYKRKEFDGDAYLKFEADCSSKYSVSYTKGKEEETRSENAYQYDSGTSKVAAKGEVKGGSHGTAGASFNKHKMNAEYDANAQLKFDAMATASKVKGEHTEKDGESRDSVTIGEIRGRAELEAEAGFHAKAEIGGSKKVSVGAELQASAVAEGELIGFQAKRSVRPKSRSGQIRVLHGKVEGRADVHAKGYAGDRKAELVAKANAAAEATLLEGEYNMGVTKKDNEYHVDGIRLRAGRGRVKAGAKFDVGNRKREVSAAAKASLLNTRALGISVKGEEDSLNAKARVSAQGVNTKYLNAKVVGRKKGSELRAKAEATALKVNALNADITGVDTRERVSAEANAGGSVNVGNVQMTGIGPGGARCEANLNAGFSAFNVTAGINRETGASASTGISVGNVDLTIGRRPKLAKGFGVGNLAIPFFGGGGGGGGGGSSSGPIGSGDGESKSNAKQSQGGTHSGEVSGSGDENGMDENDRTTRMGGVGEGAPGNDATVRPYKTSGIGQGGNGSAEPGEYGVSGDVANRLGGNSGDVVLSEWGGENRYFEDGIKSSDQVGASGDHTRPCSQTDNFGNSNDGYCPRKNGNTLDDGAFSGLGFGGNAIASSIPISLTSGDVFVAPGVGRVSEDEANGLGMKNSGKVLGRGDEGKRHLEKDSESVDENDTTARIADILANKVAGSELGKYADAAVRNRKGKSTKKATFNNTEDIKNHFVNLMTPEIPTISTGGSVDPSTAKTREKSKPKKAFGANKNIHTIFTIDGGETRPIKHMKNFACFGEGE